MKTIIYSGPGPTFKGVVKMPTHTAFETEWLLERAEAQRLCAAFIAAQVKAPVVQAAAREASWDF